MLAWVALLAWLAAASGSDGSPAALASSIEARIRPILRNLSAATNHSAWAFAYKDAQVAVQLCEGYRDIRSRTPCAATDVFAWGSTTKTHTSLRMLQLAEAGVLGLEDSIVARADSFLRRTTGADLVTLFGPLIRKVTLRNLLQMTSGLQEYDNPTVREYQNTHRAADLSPLWVIQNANRSFLCAPGSCGRYSSLNYVLLGLALAQAEMAEDWDGLDQGAWRRGRPVPLSGMYYSDHGPMHSFSTATGRHNGTIPGYQPVCGEPPYRFSCVPRANESDVSSMSSTQGWTCGNLATTVDQVALYFWLLLGQDGGGLLRPDTLHREMLHFRNCQFFGGGREGHGGNCTAVSGPGGTERHPTWSFGYGLGMMNFTSMNWGFEKEGLFYGHNGLTYGFGSQSGYNYDLEFSVSFINNIELWIGPELHAAGTQNQLYTELCSLVRSHRQAQAAARNAAAGWQGY